MSSTTTSQEGHTTLNDACEFIVDCLHKTAPTQEAGYPSIRTPNVGRGRLLLDGVNRVSEDVYVEWTKRAVPVPGDLILAREAPLLLVWVMVTMMLPAPATSQSCASSGGGETKLAKAPA